MQRLLVLNLFISLMWPILNNDFTLGALFLGFIFGFIFMSVVQRKYGLYTFRAACFIAFVLWAILQSNLQLAAKVLAGAVGMQTSMRPGIVAVPLDLANPFDITVLATVITLTPGTLSVDLGEDVSGRLLPYGEPEEDVIGMEDEKGDLAVPTEQHSAQTPFPKTPPRDRGKAALLVHAIDISNPEDFRADIKRDFESPLLELRNLIAELDASET